MDVSDRRESEDRLDAVAFEPLVALAFRGSSIATVAMVPVAIPTAAPHTGQEGFDSANSELQVTHRSIASHSTTQRKARHSGKN
jgi:hypothetical protein